MNLLSFSYWFSLQARELLPFVKYLLLGAFGLLLVLGIVAGVIASKKPESMFWAEGGKRFSKFTIWMAVLGLLLVWCTHELIYFFGSRFWYLLWTAIYLVWLFAWAKFVFADVPEKQAAYAEKARIEKWLPHHKK